MSQKIDTAALLARIDIVDVIDARVPLKKAGAEYEACCPFHTEKSPSFKVNPVKQIFHCFGCGKGGDAIAFVQEYDGLSFVDACDALGGGAVPTGGTPVPVPSAQREAVPEWRAIIPVPADAPPPPTNHYRHGRFALQWHYRDAEGRLLGLVYRFDKPEGGKEVLPCVFAESPTGAREWRWMAFPEPRPLYGLDRLAAKPDATVLVVEGEKCADAGDVELPDLVVVSWPGGGKADGKVDWSPLAGRKVITWADADAKRERITPDEEALGVDQASKPIFPEEEQPGFQTMARIRERLRSMGCKLWDVKLPPPGSQPDGWDIADAVAGGLRGKELAEFVRSNARSAVPRMTPEQAEQVAMAGLSSGTAARADGAKRRDSGPLLRDGAEWLDENVPMEWVVDGLLQRGHVVACTADTNHGKTAITLLMAMCVAAGRKFAERDILPGKVLILCGENPDGFRTRMHATMKSLGLEREDIAGLVTVLPQALPLDEGVVARIIHEARAKTGDYSMAMVDTSISFYSGDDEDDNLQARRHAWNLRALTELPGRPAVVVNCHPVKNADRDNLVPRGGSAFMNEIDGNLTVWADDGTATLHWHRKKRGPDFDPIPFEFRGTSIEEHGRNVPTVYASHISEQRENELRRQRTDQEDALLRAMLAKPDGNYVAWANAIGLNGEGGKSQVNRVMKRLKDDQLVKKYRGRFVLTKPGEEEARRARY